MRATVTSAELDGPQFGQPQRTRSTRDRNRGGKRLGPASALPAK
jgi:hypothetical protein